jgi:hypothetical protein
LRVREALNSDLPAVVAIAAANGMSGWLWPEGTFGCVAILDEVVVAFCAVREIRGGWLIEELWGTTNADGARGLSALSAWIEDELAHEAKRRGVESLRAGGFVMPHNTRHRQALVRRGYAPFAEVLAKEVQAV